MIERVVDTFVVVAIASIAILVLSVRGIVASAVLVGLAVTALLVVGVAAGIAAHRLPGAARVAAFLDRWPRAEAALIRLREGLAVASNARTVGIAVALSIASWSCTVLAFAAAAQAVGVQPTIGQAALLAAGTNLATAIPAGPGYVGTFELAVITIATLGGHRPRSRAGVRAARPPRDAARHLGRRRDRADLRKSTSGPAAAAELRPCAWRRPRGACCMTDAKPMTVRRCAPA